MHPIKVDIGLSSPAAKGKNPGGGGKIAVIILLLVCLKPQSALSASENNGFSWGIAGGFEYNGYSIREPSSGILVEWRILENKTAIFGLKTLFATDFVHIVAGELGWTFQFILFNFGTASLILRFDEAFSYTSLFSSKRTLAVWTLNMGLSARFFLTETIFIEPRIQGGYPNIFSIGVIVGFRKKYG
jgi:hypothetical protein